VVVDDQMSVLECKLKEGIVPSSSFAERQVLLARGERCVGDGQEMSMMRCLYYVKNMM
jgi:hypothetical protein